MAGSLKWMKYDSDDGKKYMVKVDESNGELFGFGDITEASIDALETLPRGYEMRYIVVRAHNGQFSRRYPVGWAGHTVFVNGGDIDVGVLSGNADLEEINCAVTYAVGEKRPTRTTGVGAAAAPSENTAGDSGLNDGDAT